MHGLETEFGDRINFVYLDIDDPNTTSFKQALRFRYQPHYLLLDGDGNIVQQWVGIITRDDFVPAFESVLQ